MDEQRGTTALKCWHERIRADPLALPASAAMWRSLASQVSSSSRTSMHVRSFLLVHTTGEHHLNASDQLS